MHRIRITRSLPLFAAALVIAVPTLSAAAATVVVPTDHATVQDAVNAVQDDTDPGEVIIESDGVFDESVTVNESVTVRAGTGFSPTILRTSGSFGPFRISANLDTATTVVLRDLTVIDDGTSNGTAISVTNNAMSELLVVELDNVEVQELVGNQGIRHGSGTGPTELRVHDSRFVCTGDGSGAPSCILQDPPQAAGTLIARDNVFQFSRADGVVQDGSAGVLVTATLDRNVFQGFEAGGFDGRNGVDISGPNSPGGIAVTMTITNNLFRDVRSAVSVNGQNDNNHTVFVNNNTIVNASENAIDLQAFSSSTVTARINNNIIFNSAGFGIDASANGGTIDLSNANNLFFANAAGDFGGSASAGAGDLTANPQFVDAVGGNFRLVLGSPAVDSGNNTPTGGLGDGFDLDGLTRIADGDGNGSDVVDRGAYESAVFMAVPTLGTWGFAILAALLLAAGLVWLRRLSPVRA